MRLYSPVVVKNEDRFSHNEAHMYVSRFTEISNAVLFVSGPKECEL